MIQPVHNDSFIYTTPVIASLAPAAQAQVSINFEADTQFVCVKTAYFVDIAGGAQTDSSRVIPLITAALTDSGSGRNLQNSAIPLIAYAGTGELPMIWPNPRPFAPNSTLSFTFTNYSAATTYTNLFFCLIGFKRFQY